jgi:hypothetical protein
MSASRTIGPVACLLWACLVITTPARAALLGISWETWGTSATQYLYDVDVNTGAATNPRNTGLTTIVGITAEPSTGTLYGFGVYYSKLYTFDQATGNPTLVGSTGISGSEGDLDFDPTTGLLYGLQWTPNSGPNRLLFTVNKSTAQATQVGDVTNGGGGDLSAMAFDPSGNLYVLNTTTSELLRVDKSTAQTLSRVTYSTKLGSTAGMDFDPITGKLYVADGGRSASSTNRLYMLDPESGAMTDVGPLGISSGLAGLTFITPEPSSLLLLGISSLALVRSHRRRN